MRRGGCRLQEVGAVVCHDDLSVLVALLRHAAIGVADGNRRTLRSTEAHGNETDALVGCLGGRGDQLILRLESLTVTEYHECPVGAALREREQRRSLRDRRRQRASRLANDTRVEVVEK